MRLDTYFSWEKGYGDFSTFATFLFCKNYMLESKRIVYYF